MSHEPPSEVGEWFRLVILVLLAPILLFVIVFTMIGSSLFGLGVDAADPKRALTNRYPNVFVNSYFIAVLGAVAIGFYLMFGG